MGGLNALVTGHLGFLAFLLSAIPQNRKQKWAVSSSFQIT
jgi:hypothetical protein